MKNTVASCSLLALVLVAALPAQAPAAVPRPIEDVLPASTYGCLQFGGLGACVRAAGQLPAAQLIENFLANVPSETRERNLEFWLDRGAEHVKHALQQQGISPGDLRAVLACPAVVGLGRPTIEGMGPSVALVLDAGNHIDSIRRVVGAIEAMGEREGVLELAGDSEIGGIAVRNWRIEDGPPIFVGELDGRFLLTNSRGYLREIGAVASGQAPCLAADSTLGKVRKHLPGNTLASFFANTGPFCAMADPVLPYEIGQWADVLGVGRLSGLFAGTSAGAHGGTDVLHIGMRGAADGLLKVAASKPVDLSLAAACSKNTVAFAAMRVDLPGLITAFGRFLDQLPQDVAAEIRHELEREIGQELRQLGTSPKEVHGLLRAFGEQMSIALSLETGAIPKPELVV